MLNIFIKDYKAINKGIQKRYSNGKEIEGRALHNRFNKGNFDKNKDLIKMALVLFANYIFLGQDTGRNYHVGCSDWWRI